jgi:hypothetical protein
LNFELESSKNHKHNNQINQTNNKKMNQTNTQQSLLQFLGQNASITIPAEDKPIFVHDTVNQLFFPIPSLNQLEKSRKRCANRLPIFEKIAPSKSYSDVAKKSL